MFNRNLFLFIFLLSALSSTGQSKDSIPKPVGYTNDFEKLYFPKEIKILDSLLADFEKRTTIQISVVTIDTNMVNENDMEDWTFRVMNAWGVGQKNRNNGILIGISKGYRHMRIENGYGIEKVLSDQETKRIIDEEFIPFFKQGKYFEGTLNGIKALMKKLE